MRGRTGFATFAAAAMAWATLGAGPALAHEAQRLERLDGKPNLDAIFRRPMT